MESMLKVRTQGHPGRWCLGVTACPGPDRTRARKVRGLQGANHPVVPSGPDTTARTTDPAVLTLAQPRLRSSSRCSHATQAGVDLDTICVRLLMRQMPANWPLRPPTVWARRGEGPGEWILCLDRN